jgi:peptidoglycan/LPS O-acetylase OafA/YrhL
MRKVAPIVRRFVAGRAGGSLDRDDGPSAIGLPSLKARVPEIDGLRGVAILLVIAFHYLEPVHRTAEGWLRDALAPSRMGWIGVNLFFVLSGYLIGSILMANRDSPTFFSAFYIRRFCRILPLYLVVVAGCYAVHHLFVRTPGPPLYQYLTFTQNFWMAAKGQFGIGLLAITWSLAVEEQFYALLPQHRCRRCGLRSSTRPSSCCVGRRS